PVGARLDTIPHVVSPTEPTPSAGGGGYGQQHRDHQGTHEPKSDDSSALVYAPRRLPSGAWQKYSYRRWDGIIGAKNSTMLPKGCSYDHPSCAVPSRMPQGAADRTTTGLLGADCPPSDESPASGTTRQDSFGAGDG